MENLIKSYEEQKSKIKSRLNSFKNLPEKEQYKEFLFCLLTPQSSAQRCWQAVKELSKLSRLNQQDVLNILKSKTRFYMTKSARILSAKENFEKIKPLLNNPDKKELRNTIAKTVNGYGLKESSHFLRNIGLSNNKIAILDRHILKNLHTLNLIKEAKIKNKKHYLEIENIFLNFTNSISIPPDHLDLLWWSQENGEIFK